MPALEQNRSIGPTSRLGVVDERRRWSASLRHVDAYAERPRRRDRVGHRAGAVAVEVGGDDRGRALGREPLGQAAADAAGRAGDDDDLALDLHAFGS